MSTSSGNNVPGLAASLALGEKVSARLIVQGQTHLASPSCPVVPFFPFLLGRVSLVLSTSQKRMPIGPVSTSGLETARPSNLKRALQLLPMLGTWEVFWTLVLAVWPWKPLYSAATPCLSGCVRVCVCVFVQPGITPGRLRYTINYVKRNYARETTAFLPSPERGFI